MHKVLFYKKRLIDLLGDCKNATILDYGCGKGEFIDLLLEKTPKPKLIFAVDSDENMLENIRKNFQIAIDDGIVVPMLVSNPTDLKEYKFDKIICQNVLECVEDKLHFINSFDTLLKQNSIFILAHHDFDTAIYNNSYTNLSRNLVHHFADTTQEWQEYSDGQMGRKIPGLISQSIYKTSATCETWRLVETTFTSGTYGFLMADMMLEIGKGTFSDADMQAWYEDLVQKNTLGEYYFAIDLVVSICKK